MDDLPELKDIDLTPLITRRIAWDMLPHDHVIDTLQEMGLVLGDQQILDMEHKESHKRQEKMADLLPIVRKFSKIAASVFTEAFMHPVEDSDLPEGVRDQFNNQNSELINAGVFAVIGQLLDAGVLTLGRVKK